MRIRGEDMFKLFLFLFIYFMQGNVTCSKDFEPIIIN